MVNSHLGSFVRIVNPPFGMIESGIVGALSHRQLGYHAIAGDLAAPVHGFERAPGAVHLSNHGVALPTVSRGIASRRSLAF